MKYLFLLIVLGCALTIVPFGAHDPFALMTHEAYAATQEKMEKQETPKPVSPARPDIRPPDVGNHWYCWQCGASNPFPKQHSKDPLHRPMLAPGSDEPGDTKGGKASRRVGKRQGLAADRILRHASELDLTTKQIERLQDLSHETKRTLIGARAKLQEEQLELGRLIRSEVSDMAALRRQIDTVARKRADIEATRLSHVIEMRKILTDEQRRMIKERRLGFRYKLERP